MIKASIDGISITAISGSTILESAIRLNIDIPHFCSHLLPLDGYECRLCMVLVKQAESNDFKLEFACTTPIENGMIILSENSEEIVKYRTSLLLSYLHTHRAAILKQDNLDKFSLFKHYLAKYGVRYDGFEITEHSDIDGRIGLPPLLNADYSKCIECGNCKKYQRFEIYGYSTMVVDLCPTGVFSLKENKIADIKHLDLEEIDSYCPYCDLICECKYRVTPNSIVSMHSRGDKKYGICDVGRQLRHVKASLLKKPLKNGTLQSIDSVKKIFKEYFKTLEPKNIFASLSAFYPTDDMREMYIACDRLGISSYRYRTEKFSTNTPTENASMSNIKAIDAIGKWDLKEDSDLQLSNYSEHEFDGYLIINDPILENSKWFNGFCEKNIGKYVILTPYNSYSADNAYLAIPIAGFGEFSGYYIDKRLEQKYVPSIIKAARERPSVAEILKHLLD